MMAASETVCNLVEYIAGASTGLKYLSTSMSTLWVHAMARPVAIGEFH